MGNPLCHFEIVANNNNNAKAFYDQVFDWDIIPLAIPGHMDIDTKTGSDGSSGPPGVLKEGSPDLLVFFEVENIDTTLVNVQTAGGSVAVPKTPYVKGGFYAIFKDPDNVMVGIYEDSVEVEGK